MKHSILKWLPIAVSYILLPAKVTAQWVEPIVVEPAMGDVTVPEDGGVYFLYNAATDLYVGAGNNWGAHVVATTVSDAFPAVFWDQAISLSGGGNDYGTGEALPITLTKTENESYYLQHLGTNRGDRYLTSEDGNSWIDGGTGRRIDFIITATEGGYTIQASNTAEAGTYFGVDEGETTHEEFEMVSLNVMNSISAGERAVWQFISTNYEAWEVYNARVAFYALYQEIQESGYTVDYSAAKAVYDNANATKEQLETATAELSRLFNKTKFQDAFKGASEDAPIDVTEYCIVNPDFEEPCGNGQMPKGWEITIKGQNLGQQNRTDTNPETGLAITNYFDAWIPSPYVLGDGVIAQTVDGLPQGKYKLECDASACHHPQVGDGTDIEGVNLFIQSGEFKATQRISNLPLYLNHYEVTFTKDENEVSTFGLEVNGTNANLLSADNFRLTYYGNYCQFVENGMCYLKINERNVAVSFYSLESDNANFYRGHISIPETVSWDGVTYNVIKINKYAFRGCKDLTSITIPNSITSIDENAFEGCSGLTSVQIPNSVTSIGDEAFTGCSGLTSVQIPNSVTNIGNYAFQDCSLTTVSVDIQEPLSIYSNVFSYYSNDTYYSYTGLATLYVPAGCKEAYEAADVWKDFKEIIEMEPEPEADTDITQLDNAIYVEAQEVLVGQQYKLPILLKNVLTPVGCSFKLTLPDGFSLVKDYEGDVIYEFSDRTRKMSVVMHDWNDGSYDFALTPATSSATITGTEGVIITLHVKVSESAMVGNTIITLSNCLIQNVVSGMTQDYAVPDVKTTFTIVDHTLGDVNGDGNVTPADAIMILYHYFNVQQEGFIAAAADVNDDGNISPADAIEALYQYFGVRNGNSIKAVLEDMLDPR